MAEKAIPLLLPPPPPPLMLLLVDPVSALKAGWKDTEVLHVLHKLHR
jgi:hypothetical protein